jgi:hypothetical protein
MSRFKGLQSNIAAKAAPAPAEVQSGPSVVIEGTSTKAKAREGKKAIVGYFSADMSRQLRVMSIEEGTTVQALVGEAIDLLMRARGKHPFGER